MFVLRTMDTISLNEALQQMDNGVPFHIKFVAFNKAQRKGGHFIEIHSGVKANAKYSLSNNDMISVKETNNSNHPYPVHKHLITEYNHKRVMI